MSTVRNATYGDEALSEALGLPPFLTSCNFRYAVDVIRFGGELLVTQMMKVKRAYGSKSARRQGIFSLTVSWRVRKLWGKKELPGAPIHSKKAAATNHPRFL